MRRYRFLFSVRWIGLILTVAILVTAFGFLARWQLGRNVERSGENARIEAGMKQPPKPLEVVLQPDKPVDSRTEWRTVTARGQYDVKHQLLVRYRHLEGEAGFEVLTPLVTTDGTALLVDRGWIPSMGGTRPVEDPPDPPEGDVLVTGRVRATERGAAVPTGGQVRFINVGQIAQALPYPAYGGYLELTAQDPKPGDTPHLLPEPELDAGPFLSYGIQWYLFGVIALVGLGILAYDEAHDGKLRRRWRMPARKEHEGVDDAGGLRTHR